MEKTTLSTKGQLILPKSVRDANHWSPGTQFSVEQISGGVFLRPIPLFKPTTIEEAYGCLKYNGRAKTLKEMELAIAKGVRERHDRGRY